MVFQEASLRALEVSGGRCEGALDILAKQQHCDLSNGCAKSSSGNYIFSIFFIYEYKCLLYVVQCLCY